MSKIGPAARSSSPSFSEEFAGGKRKLDAELESAGKKSAKRRRSKKPRDIDDEELDTTLGVNRAIARMDSRLLADHLAQRMKRFQRELTSVEVEDRHVQVKAILDTASWERPRDLENLPAFLDHFTSDSLSAAPKTRGAPHTIVVASAGLRAADITRALRKFQTKEVKVAKLFAKHIKLKDAIESTKQTRMNIGVGTAQRITDLLDAGALSGEALRRIVIDASHIDVKKRGILDMKETHAQLIDLLSRPEFKARYGSLSDRLDCIFY